jgi:hypothetical protein
MASVLAKAVLNITESFADASWQSPNLETTMSCMLFSAGLCIKMFQRNLKLYLIILT